jgi:hypothetical protein
MSGGILVMRDVLQTDDESNAWSYPGDEKLEISFKQITRARAVHETNVQTYP